MKDLEFLGSSKKDLISFPEEAKAEAGYQLHKVQCGNDPSDWKPMTSIGSGVKEIRINTDNQYRVIYLAKLEHKVYVLHAFMKKTRKTEKRDINLAKSRLMEVT